MARRRRPIGPLDLRAQAILRAVIEEYVTTATPVGSQALVERYRPRRVQRDRAEHPRRARGERAADPPAHLGRTDPDRRRVPVLRRVDRGRVPLPAVEQLMIRHQFGQVEFASEHWFRLAATTLASVTRAAGLATPAKPRDAHIRRIDLVAINERMASLILVLREGSIKQALITLDGDDSIDQPTLNAGGGAAQRATGRPDRAPVPRPGWRTCAMTTARGGPGAVGSAIGSSGSSGSTTRRPSRRSSATACSTSWRPRSSPRATSFGGSSAPSRTGPTWASSSAASPAPDGSRSSSVTRTSRSRCRTSRSCSRRTGAPGRAIGVVGVLGPTRMSYSQAIGTVRFVSGLMNELVDHLYA